MNHFQKKKNILLLLVIAGLHTLCMVMSFHLDLFRRSNYPFARASNPNYWLWISSWWCIWVGWLTIIWVIYKLFKREKTSYFEQIFDLTVLMANLLMILAFVANFLIYYLWKIEWIYVPDADNPLRTIKIFNTWEIKTQNYYLLNITISHIVAPFILLYYFLKFSKVNLLKEKLKLTLIGVLLNPVVWFVYVILREKSSNYWIHSGKISWDFPRNYPYVFFYRIMGQPAYQKDINYSSSAVSRFLWLSGVILVAGITFASLAWLLIKIKLKKQAKSEVIS